MPCRIESTLCRPNIRRLSQGICTVFPCTHTSSIFDSIVGFRGELAHHEFFERRTSPEMMVRCVFSGLYPGCNSVAKKMRTYFEMGTDGHRVLCFYFGIILLRRYLRGVSIHLRVCLIYVISQQMVKEKYFHSECVIEPQVDSATSSDAGWLR